MAMIPAAGVRGREARRTGVRRKVVFSVVGMAGLAAFCWTLVTASPPARGRRRLDDLARWAEQRGRVTEAVRLQREWVRLWPSDSRGWFDLARYEARTGDSEAATRAWVHACRVGARGPSLAGVNLPWYELAQDRAIACDTDGALEALEEAVEQALAQSM